MSAGHTPGPWSASAPDASYHDVIRIFVDADPEGAAPVAVCPQRKSAIMEVMAGSTNETTEAAHNARLIAAAPELLEVAERILDRGYVSENIEEERGDHQALKAAIAKALGTPNPLPNPDNQMPGGRVK